jgi:hypothetical protein
MLEPCKAYPVGGAVHARPSVNPTARLSPSYTFFLVYRMIDQTLLCLAGNTNNILALQTYVLTENSDGHQKSAPLADMTSSMNTILIIGATSGLGEGFTRRFHALGKNSSSPAASNAASLHCERSFQALRSALYVKANPCFLFECARLTNHPARCDRLQALPANISEITTSFPTIHTPSVNAETINPVSLAYSATSRDMAITTEVTTDFTAPLILPASSFHTSLHSRNPPPASSLSPSASTPSTAPSRPPPTASASRSASGRIPCLGTR